MPPINQQSSRAGLYTALAAFTILFIVSTVLAIQYYGKWQQAVIDYTTYRKNYNGIVSDGALQSTPVQQLIAARADGKLGIASTDSVLDTSIKETYALAQALGSTNPEQQPSALLDTVKAAIDDSQKKLDTAGIKLSLPTSGLPSDLSAVTDSAVVRERTIVSLNNQVRDVQARLLTATSDLTKLSADHDAAIAALNSKSATDLAQVNTVLAGTTATITSIQGQEKADADKALADQTAKENEIAGLKAEIGKLNARVLSVQGKLANRRVAVNNSTIRQADCHIIRVPNSSVCYIDLGEGNQVSPGLTFEVYGREEGVPGIPENVSGDEQLPVGKASIEITHVGSTSSECRIVRTQPGQIVAEGDVCANLVYDPRTKYNFFVFGNFDLAGNGRPNAPDAEVIKRLITQWGGKLIDLKSVPGGEPGAQQLSVDTDFVVLGSEPVIPTFSRDDLTAENTHKVEEATAALNKYQEIRSQATELHIPILNQNRFLYYVGFYDQAKR